MKYTLTILFFAILSAAAFSQTTVPKHWELKGLTYTQSDSIHEVWMKTEFPTILKKNKLKMKCDGCSNIYMDVVFGIDGAGLLLGINVKKSVCCGGEFSEKLKSDFLAYFGNFKFPPSLLNLTFEYRLGTGLSC